uniref:Coagulation factor VIII-like n=1 Tax=Sinocyclocheilus rhinocerous TaxID=307959 RepID=A0A673K2E5_9TELE
MFSNCIIIPNRKLASGVQKYIKAVYTEYTDSTFTTPKSKPPWAGIQGPTIRTVVNDRVVVHFKNFASQFFSISPIGIPYWKQSEGAGYEDSSSVQERADDAVPPGGYYKYVWDISPNSGPTTSDPDCLTYIYSSQVDIVRDFNSGLVGTLLICKTEALTEERQRKAPEFILLLAVFDESKSWYREVGRADKLKKTSSPTQYHTINGYINSTLPGAINAKRNFQHHYCSLQFYFISVNVYFILLAKMFFMVLVLVNANNTGVRCQVILVRWMKNNFSWIELIYLSLWVEDKQVDLRSLAVPPGEIMMYLWKLTADDGPTEADPRCLTRLYQSMVDPVRDVASGLVGPLIICKSQSLDKRGRVVTSDKEKNLLFTVFDENRSWYFEENINKNSEDPTKIDRNDPDFYNSNVMHTVNGFMFNHLQFRVCVGDVILWHVASIGIQNNFLSVYFTGNTFERDKTYGTVLTLFPMTGDTVTTEVEMLGEWEVSAFDPSLKQRGMSVRYTVVNCERVLPMVDSEDYDDEFIEFIERNFPIPRGTMEKNRTIAIRVCRNRTMTDSAIGRVNTSSDNERQSRTRVCEIRYIPVKWEKDLDALSQGGIPQDILDQLDGEMGGNSLERQKRSHNESEPYRTRPNEIDPTVINRRELWKSGSSGLKQDKMEESLNLHYKDPKKFQPNLELVLEPMSNSSDNQTYDNVSIRSTESRFRSYYIAAEEIMWDYGINKPAQLIKPREMRRGMRKYFPAYKKVVFRAYQDRDFKHPIKRGELDEHLGIMGPVLKAEINDVLTVVFKNLASRPYSFHLHGVYDKMQGSFNPGTGDPVPPGEERVYNWRVSRRQGPSASEFDCKAGAYYSNINMEKDINSGLIGPVLICHPGTLHPRVLRQPDVTDFFLLFTTFDERKSWYLDYNIRKFCTPPCQAKVDDPWFEMSNKFAAINGYVSETLPGLIVEQYQTARWHLLNVGSRGEFHAVHFHGLPFGVGKNQEHRMGVFNLYPGVFGTVEMRPAIVGTWLIECTIGEHQMAGMRAKLLVYNPRCIQPLGIQSGWIDNKQITASDHYGNWKPSLARLELSGSINAWMGSGTDSWLQVDLLRPMLLHGIRTQGAKTSMGLSEYFTILYSISYSIDQENWTTYQGNSTKSSYTFNGNMDGSRIKENLFSPPVVGRYIRIHPLTFQKKPTLRIELLGCDLNSCSMPLGMERRLIPSSSISASSFLNKWLLSWSPDLARLHQEGRANAWRPKTNNPHEWLQVDFLSMKRVTGVVTQGARSALKPMTVTEFTVSISNEGHRWTSVKEQGTDSEKIFEGNSEHDEEALNVFDPPLFTRFIRIHPKGWVNDIALRLELLGCDTQPTL